MIPALNAGFKAFCEATSTFYDPVNDCENRVETGAYGVNGYTEFNDGWGDSEIIRQSDNAKVLAPTLNAYLNRHGFTGETWGSGPRKSLTSVSTKPWVASASGITRRIVHINN